MIRREDLAAEPTGVADLIAERVKAGESVRIIGLGTLAKCQHRIDFRAGAAIEHACAKCGRDCPSGSLSPLVYRLTLTAALVRSLSERQSEDVSARRNIALEADARHLARALGAPVEVWAATRHGGRFDTARAQHVSYPPKLIATVKP